MVGWKVWAMLPMRIVLAIAFQGVFAFGYLLAANDSPWQAAANMWLASFALAEFCNLWLLVRLARGEGIRLVDLYNPRRPAVHPTSNGPGLLLSLPHLSPCSPQRFWHRLCGRTLQSVRRCCFTRCGSRPPGSCSSSSQ